jgi:uncharacterized membrane protein YsdA (DUF1294 family)
MAVGTIASLILLVFFLIRGVSSNPTAQAFTGLDSVSFLGVPGFVLYIIAVNIVAFIAFTADYFVWSKNVSKYVSEGETASFLNILGAIGGGASMLLAVLLWGKGIHKYNVGWVVYAFCFTMIWGGILVLVYSPFDLEMGAMQHFTPIVHISLLVYLGIINILSVVVILWDRNGGKRNLRVKDILIYLISLLGGAIGVYATVMVTGSKSKTHYASTMPILVIVNVFTVFFLLVAGVA